MAKLLPSPFGREERPCLEVFGNLKNSEAGKDGQLFPTTNEYAISINTLKLNWKGFRQTIRTTLTVRVPAQVRWLVCAFLEVSMTTEIQMTFTYRQGWEGWSKIISQALKFWFCDSSFLEEISCGQVG